jgi:hypothetical protein
VILPLFGLALHGNLISAFIGQVAIRHPIATNIFALITESADLSTARKYFVQTGFRIYRYWIIISDAALSGNLPFVLGIITAIG